MLKCFCILLGALVCASLGCAHRSKNPSAERSLVSNSLLADTNSPPGSVYSTKIYVIQIGDSFAKIAARFGVSANELKRLNPMVNTTRLAIGQQIRVGEEKFTPFLDEPEWFTAKKPEPALTREQQARLKELSQKLKTGNSVADIDRLKDSLNRWDELFVNPAPPDLKPVYAIFKDRVKERIVGLEIEKEEFGISILGDFADARERMRHHKHVLLVCITACQWEDKGRNEHSLHHFTGTVVKSYKGDWKISEQINFVHAVDARGSDERNESQGELFFIFTNEHTDKEFAIDAGDFLRYDAKLGRQLEMVLSR